MEESVKNWTEYGCPPVEITGASFPGQGWYKASRVVQKKGVVTESMTGEIISKKPLA